MNRNVRRSALIPSAGAGLPWRRLWRCPWRAQRAEEGCPAAIQEIPALTSERLCLCHLSSSTKTSSLFPSFPPPPDSPLHLLLLLRRRPADQARRKGSRASAEPRAPGRIRSAAPWGGVLGDLGPPPARATCSARHPARGDADEGRGRGVRRGVGGGGGGGAAAVAARGEG